MTDLVITDIEPQPSDPNIMRIRVAGRIAARLPATEVEKLALAPGDAWTEQIVEQIDRVIQSTKLRKHALRLLGNRAYARGELAERLGRKTDDTGLIEEVLTELEEGFWLDDEAYARQLIEDIQLRNPQAEPVLIEKLILRKIDPALAAKVVQSVLEVIDPLDSAEQLARKHLKKLTRQPPEVIARRVWGLLARRGFDEQVIETTLSRLDISCEQAPD